MAGSDATHVVNMPSTPPGWSAGKWGEWYLDIDNGKQGLTTKIPKAYWQSGWRLQHDRLLRAASEMRGRIPLFISGDLHAIGEARILETSAFRLRINPVITVLPGPVGTGGRDGHPSCEDSALFHPQASRWRRGCPRWRKTGSRLPTSHQSA